MLVATPTHTLERTGVLREEEFAVTMGPFLVDMLTKQYADPFFGIAREYITNAVDAYDDDVAALAARPIEIHAPTIREPYFSVTDYGSGMDEQALYRTYRFYNLSLKRDAASQHGGFGVGAKIAFAYPPANPWSITTRKDGMRYVAMAYINERGVPTLGLLERAPTEEPNGTTVSIPIAPDDVASFRERLRYFLTFFKVPLLLQGDALPPTAPYDDCLFDSTDGAIYASSEQTILVTLGNVPYEIPRAYINQVLPSYYEAGIISGTYVLKFPIGAFPVTPNRESIIISQEALATLRTRMRQVAAACKAHFATTFCLDAATEYAAHLQLAKLRNRPTWRDVLRSCDVRWTGGTIAAGHGASLSRTVTQLTAALGGPVSAVRVVNRGRRGKVRLERDDALAISLGTSERQLMLPVSARVLVFADDAPLRRAELVRTIFTSNEDRELYFIAAMNMNVDAISEALGGVKVYSAAEELALLPPPLVPEPRARDKRRGSVSRKPTLLRLFRPCDQYQLPSLSTLQEVAPPPMEEGVTRYYVMSRGQALALASQDLRVLSRLYGMGRMEDPVYVVPQTAWRDIKTRPDFVPVTRRIEELRKRLLVDLPTLLQCARRTAALRAIGAHNDMEFVAFAAATLRTIPAFRTVLKELPLKYWTTQAFVTDNSYEKVYGALAAMGVRLDADRFPSHVDASETFLEALKQVRWAVPTTFALLRSRNWSHAEFPLLEALLRKEVATWRQQQQQQQQEHARGEMAPGAS